MHGNERPSPRRDRPENSAVPPADPTSTDRRERSALELPAALSKATYTQAEMLGLLGIGEKTLRGMIRRGDLPHVRTGRGATGKILFLKPQIDEWLRTGGSTGRPGR